MAMIKCPECGKEISDKTEVCIHCGYNFRKPQKKKKWILIVGIIIIFIAIAMAIGNHDSNMLDSEVYNMVIDEYTKEYGTPEDASYGLSWETSKSIIAVKQYPGTTDGTMIMYSKKED